MGAQVQPAESGQVQRVDIVPEFVVIRVEEEQYQSAEVVVLRPAGEGGRTGRRFPDSRETGLRRRRCSVNLRVV